MRRKKAIEVKFNHKEFADAIYDKRRSDRENKQSLEDVAQLLGLSKATLSRVENEKTPDVVTYAKVCRWLGCSMEAFISL